MKSVSLVRAPLCCNTLASSSLRWTVEGLQYHWAGLSYALVQSCLERLFLCSLSHVAVSAPRHIAPRSLQKLVYRASPHMNTHSSLFSSCVQLYKAANASRSSCHKLGSPSSSSSLSSGRSVQVCRAPSSYFSFFKLNVVDTI
jgi:hypothetical protein